MRLLKDGHIYLEDRIKNYKIALILQDIRETTSDFLSINIKKFYDLNIFFIQSKIHYPKSIKSQHNLINSVNGYILTIIPIIQFFSTYLMQQIPKAPIVIFILGGPGSGKGTVSQKINNNFKFHHLSAGDLLRAERNTKGSQYGQIIEKNIVEGKIVPSHITVSLLQNAMKKEGFEGGRFLIDGFPRNLQNLQAWQKGMDGKVTIPFIIHLQCGQAIMEQRLLKRGQTSGRSDDNIQSIKKRFKTYEQQTKQIIDYFTNLGKNVNINSENTPDKVFEQVTVLFKKHNLV